MSCWVVTGELSHKHLLPCREREEGSRSLELSYQLLAIRESVGREALAEDERLRPRTKRRPAEGPDPAVSALHRAVGHAIAGEREIVDMERGGVRPRARGRK